MCGRFAATTPPDQIAAYFGAEASAEPDEFEPDYNVAPTHDVPVVRIREGSRHLDYLRWGLVPFWAKDLRIGSKMINARSETVESKNAYRTAFTSRRCLLSADGFYEWKRLGPKEKQPMYISRADGDLLALAGLYERWTDAEKLREFHTCTILTCEANDFMSNIHDRMPVMLSPSNWDEWLAPDNTDIASLKRLLIPAPESLLQAHRVSTQVNSVRNNDHTLIEAVA